jgi:hypothetical protein
MTEPRPGADFRHDIKVIRRELRGIEWFVATILYLLWYTLLSYWLSRCVSKGRPRIIEYYVVSCVGITVANWWCGPWCWLSVLCSYFAGSTIVTLLQVVFLSKVVGDVESPERSLLLFICNVVQIVFMFASWYQLVGGYAGEEALFYSMLILATAGYPPNARMIVELQITSDIVLVAVFLAHILGKLGRNIARSGERS